MGAPCMRGAVHDMRRRGTGTRIMLGTGGCKLGPQVATCSGSRRIQVSNPRNIPATPPMCPNRIVRVDIKFPDKPAVSDSAKAFISKVRTAQSTLWRARARELGVTL